MLSRSSMDVQRVRSFNSIKLKPDIKKKMEEGSKLKLSQCDVLFRWCQENIIPIYSFINLPKQEQDSRTGGLTQSLFFSSPVCKQIFPSAFKNERSNSITSMTHCIKQNIIVIQFDKDVCGLQNLVILITGNENLFLHLALN